MLAADPSGLSFDKAVREAGEDCRRTLARVCRWHKAQGMKIECPAPLPGETAWFMPHDMKRTTAL